MEAFSGASPSPQPPQDNMAAVHGRWVDGQLAPVWIDPRFGWFVECKGFA